MKERLLLSVFLCFSCNAASDNKNNNSFGESVVSIRESNSFTSLGIGSLENMQEKIEEISALDLIRCVSRKNGKNVPHAGFYQKKLELMKNKDPEKHQRLAKSTKLRLNAMTCEDDDDTPGNVFVDLTNQALAECYQDNDKKEALINEKSANNTRQILITSGALFVSGISACAGLGVVFITTYFGFNKCS